MFEVCFTLTLLVKNIIQNIYFTLRVCVCVCVCTVYKQGDEVDVVSNFCHRNNINSNSTQKHKDKADKRSFPSFFSFSHLCFFFWLNTNRTIHFLVIKNKCSVRSVKIVTSQPFQEQTNRPTSQQKDISVNLEATLPKIHDDNHQSIEGNVYQSCIYISGTVMVISKKEWWVNLTALYSPRCCAAG